MNVVMCELFNISDGDGECCRVRVVHSYERDGGSCLVMVAARV